MVRQRPDGLFETVATMPKELANELTEAVENDPEASEAQLVRKGLRRELQARMEDKDGL